MKPFTTTVLMAIAFVIMPSPAAFAHQDMIINVGRTGDLEGLPEQYSPARLRVAYGKAGYVNAVVLRLGDRVTEFPTCLSALFQLPKRQKIELRASWYHDPENLPYYLSIELPCNESKRGMMQGWSLLLNLETAELLDLRWTWITSDGYGQNARQIDVSTLCSDEEIKQFVPRVIPEDRKTIP